MGSRQLNSGGSAYIMEFHVEILPNSLAYQLGWPTNSPNADSDITVRIKIGSMRGGENMKGWSCTPYLEGKDEQFIDGYRSIIYPIERVKQGRWSYLVEPTERQSAAQNEPDQMSGQPAGR